ncbi:glycosyltransferase family 71 protein [Dichotomopilus funicola]|uniref:Glycosyltransferase family 71 protein n=1 Tax=Dichotomopilus funicola TaxID=1934379 RepID=A0AAN6UU61_9PEZI|nr:glycosyltransferase family 71 protein [Dichotomopilus funicola]
MVGSRRTRAVVGVAVVFLLIFLGYHNLSVLSEIPTTNFLPDTFLTKPTKAAQLHPKAHTLPNPDAFRDHFAAVVRQKSITIAEAKESCHWSQDEEVNFQFTPDSDWVVKERPDEEIDARRKAWQHFVTHDMIPWETVKDKFSGRGIVVLAGNHDTTMRLKVVLRRLTKLKATIPIEVHYWADEMSPANRHDLAALYPHTTFNDLSLPHNILHVRKDSDIINFQLKPAALINSRFAEPLLLDSDNIPILDPSTLFDSTAYREYHTVFWPDIARTRPQNPAWAITNTHCRMDEYEQESGQMLVDKRRFWYHLQLAAWLNIQQGKYYNAFLLGDKDMFRFAWHALRTEYGRPSRWLTSVGTLNEGTYCGHSFAQYHPDRRGGGGGGGGIAFLHGGLVKSVSLEAMRWNREVKGGYFRNYKRAESDEDPGKSVRVGMTFDGADYMPNKTDRFRAAMCTEMRDVRVGDLEEILPGWEKEYEALGGYWMLEQEAKAEA